MQISTEFPHEYLVHPLTVDIHFTMNREILTTDPKLALQLATKDISMALNAEQYQRLLNTITHLNTYLRKLWVRVPQPVSLCFKTNTLLLHSFWISQIWSALLAGTGAMHVSLYWLKFVKSINIGHGTIT